MVLTIIGLSTLASQRGAAAILRAPLNDNLATFFEAAGRTSQRDILSARCGTPLQGVVASLIALAGLMWIFKTAPHRRSLGKIGSGILVVGVLTFGWRATVFTAAHFVDPLQMAVTGPYRLPIPRKSPSVFLRPGMVRSKPSTDRSG